MGKFLSEIVKGIDGKFVGKDVFIESITSNSNFVQKGSLFFAVKGKNFDSHKIIDDLYLKGCRAFVVEREINPKKDAGYFICDVRKNIGKIARNFFEPKAKFIGITGTKGKSSTVQIIGYTLAMNGIKTGVLGSLWWELTTPESIDTLRISKFFDVVVMEVTSISVVMGRIEGIEFDFGVFLNLGRDHLDFHKTMENYFSAKKDFVMRAKNIVVGIDDEWGKRLANEIKAKTFSLNQGFGKVLSISERYDETEFEFEVGGERIKFKTKFKGGFNYQSFLASYIVLRDFGLSKDEILKGFEEVFPPRGRMELVAKNPYVYIDYAHNPESLFAACSFLNRIKGSGKLIVVFGCGGERDKEKRPIMGKIASEMADIVIITNDNPRNEDPKNIINDILSGIERKNFIVEERRDVAISYALSFAKNEDIVLIAGKGHENYQITRGGKLKFSDFEVVKSLLQSKHQVLGYPHQFLP